MTSLSAAADAEVAKQWLEDLKGACNDLTKHYLNLLKAASPSADDQQQQQQQQGRSAASSERGGEEGDGASEEAIIASQLLDKEMAADQAMLDYAAAVQASATSGGDNSTNPAAALGGLSATRPRDIASSVAANAQAMALQTRVSCDNIVEQTERLLMLISQLKSSILLAKVNNKPTSAADEERRERLVEELLQMEK